LNENSLAGSTIREFHESDTEKIVQLCEDTRSLPDSTPVNLVDLVLALRSKQPAMVAESKQSLVGFILSEVRGDRAIVTAMRIAPRWRHQKLGSQLLRGLEDQVLHLGVRRIEALLGPGQIGEEALSNRGFTATRGLTLYSKDEPLAPSEVSLLDAWGGELIDPDAWDNIAGMVELKQVIEDRIVRPILEDDLAKLYGVRIPSTVMLFGPPGTGKTSFARALNCFLRKCPVQKTAWLPNWEGLYVNSGSLIMLLPSLTSSMKLEQTVWPIPPCRPW
jgi:transitional endoplasmic reticulum ATPase